MLCAKDGVEKRGKRYPKRRCRVVVFIVEWGQTLRELAALCYVVDFIHTHSSATKAAGVSTTNFIPLSTLPPTSTTLITPALRATIFLFGSLTMNFSCSP